MHYGVKLARTTLPLEKSCKSSLMALRWKATLVMIGGPWKQAVFMDQTKNSDGGVKSADQ